MRVSEVPQVRRSAPVLGADTRTVLTDLLGHDTARISRLAQSGVIGVPRLT